MRFFLTALCVLCTACATAPQVVLPTAQEPAYPAISPDHFLWVRIFSRTPGSDFRLIADRVVHAAEGQETQVHEGSTITYVKAIHPGTDDAGKPKMAVETAEANTGYNIRFTIRAAAGGAVQAKIDAEFAALEGLNSIVVGPGGMKIEDPDVAEQHLLRSVYLNPHQTGSITLRSPSPTISAPAGGPPEQEIVLSLTLLHTAN